MSERINLQDLSVFLAEKMSITKKDAEIFLREYFEMLSEELISGGLVKIKDLGAFKLLPVEDRESVDVTTGERVLIPAHYKVAFTPDKKLAETINEPFSFFETTEIDDESAPEELQLLPEEDVTEESELSADEEEDAVLEKEPEEIEVEKEKIPEEKKEEIPIEENPVLEENPHIEEKPFVEEITDKTKEKIPDRKPTFSKETSAYCLTCHDYEAHRVYRKKYYNARKKLNVQRVFIIILSLLLAAALGYIAYMTIYDKNILAPIFHKATTNSISPENIVPADSITTVATPTATPDVTPTDSDSIAPAENPVEQDTVVITVPSVSSVDSKQITISSGDRLTTIAQKEYGNRVFWIYIYLDNKTVIRNPDILPVGETIIIPPAAKYGIDCNDPASIKKAKEAAVRNP